MRPPARPSAPAPRRPWLIALPLAAVVLVALAWTGLWFYAASRTETAIAGWRVREAEFGRIHTCGEQSLGGYPFRIELRCRDPGSEWRSGVPPLTVSAKAGLLAAQVYDPTLVIGEFTGPLAIAESGRPTTMIANWALAQASLRAAPMPRQASIVFDKPEFARTDRGITEMVARADHLELHGRLAAGSADNNPAIEVVVRLGAASAPGLHPLTAQPTDGEIAALVFGLKDFTAKPWPARLREMQAVGGRIEITQARLAQGEILLSGSGALGLTASGRLDGQIMLTIAGIERLTVLLGIDQMVSQYLAQRGGGVSVDKIASGLDRIMPGLGGAVRGNSAAALAATGIVLLGEPTQLEGRRAVRLPLRFSDGMAFLGPLAIGQTAPLF